MGKRRSSRELAMRFLYQAELNPRNLKEQMKDFWERNPCQEDIEVFTEDLVHKIFSKKEEIDALLEKYSENWPLSRMAVIDRNLLRLATCEILYYKNVPPKVAIDEAVEISKKYGSVESPNFINGILDRIMKEREEELTSPPITRGL